MFDIGWSEMLVIGVVALIVVGPKDLPKMFRTLGEVTGKAKGMAREFQRAMDLAAKESGVSDLARDLKKTASGQAFKEATGFDEIEKDFRAIGRDAADVRKRTPDGVAPDKTAAAADEATNTATITDGATADEATADEAEAADHDAAVRAAKVSASNDKLTATEELRLAAANKKEAARLKAADARARRAAAADSAAAPTPAAPPASET